MPVQKKYFSISPINDNPVISGGGNVITQGFSHRQGNPTVRFSIPAKEALLEVDSLRLVGQFIVKTANDNAMLVSRTNIDDNNGNNLARATSANIPNFGGVQSCIDKVVIQSKKTNTELSNTTNYSMNASLMECYKYSQDDYAQGEPSCQALSQGYNANFSNRRINISADQAAQGLGTPSNKQIGQMFSMKLEVDMFQAGDLHLGQDYLSGLLITLHLAPDSAVFHQRFREVLAGQTDASLNNVMYVLKNLKLEGRYVQPYADDLKEYQPVKVMNAKLNVLNDLHSDDNSIQYTPQLSSVKSVINLFLDNDQQNNRALQQNNFKLPMGLKEVEQSKDNLRFPLSYPVKVQPNVTTTSNSGLALSTFNDVFGDRTNQGISRLSDLVGDAEVRLHFERALLGRESKKNANSVGKLNDSLENDYQGLADGTANARGSNMTPVMLGIGADYSYGLQNSINYQNRDYGAAIKSGVASGLPIYPAMSNNKSELVQTYIKHVATLDTQKLVKSM